MGLAWRYITVGLVSIGLAIIYGLKVNLSVTIVSMVNHTAIQAQDTPKTAEGELPVQECEKVRGDSGSTSSQDGPFVWTKSMQGNLLSSYFWGYLLAMFPGSQLAEILSAKWSFFVAVALNIACTLATPVLFRLHYYLAFATRVMQGLGGGLTFPTTHVLLSHWVPPAERGTMSSIAFSGTLLGTVISTFMSGRIAVALGWEWVYYIMGASSSLWLVLWFLLVSDRPDTLRFVKDTEVKYIESSLGVGHVHVKEKHKVPWLKIFKSLPFWAILVAHMSSTWAFYILLTNMPLYMRTVLDFGMCQISTLSAIPYVGMLIFSLAAGEILDVLRKKGKMSTAWARKTATLISSVFPMTCLILLCIFGEEKWIAVALLIIAMTTMGAMFCGFMTNHIDIAPNYAGTLMGITNTFATIPGVVGPILVGSLTQNDPSINSWRIIFGIICGFYVLEILAFTIFASGEEQPWNKPEAPKGTAE